jgi:methanogenic corrinoid protein MtbC1
VADTFVRAADRHEGDSCEDVDLTIELIMARTAMIARTIHGNQAQSHLNDIASTIETAIIPRLMLLHGAGAEGAAGRGADMNDLSPQAPAHARAASRIDSFIELTLHEDNSLAFNYLERLMADGTSVEVLLLDVLAPAARTLGDMWETDLIGFMDVTLGLSRIQQLLRQIRQTTQGRTPLEAVKGRALLVPAPGEQHTFGLRVVEEFLLRDGWDVRSDLGADEEEIIRLVSEDDYIFVGLSLSGHRLLPELCSAIRNIRANSRNRNIQVMVGGVYFTEHPDAVQDVDADALVNDPLQAVEKANDWHQPPRMN